MFSTVFCCLLNGLNEWHLPTRGAALSVIKTRINGRLEKQQLGSSNMFLV